jgi:hypothetical protein
VQDDYVADSTRWHIMRVLNDAAWVESCSGRRPGTPPLPGATSEQIRAKIRHQAVLTPTLEGMVLDGVLRQHIPAVGDPGVRDGMTAARMSPRYAVRRMGGYGGGGRV